MASTRSRPAGPVRNTRTKRPDDSAALKALLKAIANHEKRIAKLERSRP